MVGATAGGRGGDRPGGRGHHPRAGGHALAHRHLEPARACPRTPTERNERARSSPACARSTPSTRTTPASAWPWPAASPPPTSCPAPATSSAGRRSTSSSAAGPSRRCGSTATCNGTEILGGLKMANGENPKGYGKNKQQAPFTRMKIAALQRETFVKAQEYKAKHDAGQKVDRDIALDTARRGAGRQAHGPLPLPPRRRPHDRGPHRGGVRVRDRPAARHRGLSRRGHPREEEDSGVADAGRQPRRQARDDRPARGERGDPGQGRRARSRSTPTTASPSRGSSCAPGRSPSAAA